MLSWFKLKERRPLMLSLCLRWRKTIFCTITSSFFMKHGWKLIYVHAHSPQVPNCVNSDLWNRWNFKKIHGMYSFSYNRSFITEAQRQNIKELLLSSQKIKVSSSQFSQNLAIKNLYEVVSGPKFLCWLESISNRYHLVGHGALAGLVGFLIYQ